MSRGRPWSSSEELQIIKLLKGGYSPQEVARKLSWEGVLPGRSSVAIERRCREIVWIRR